MTRTPATVTSAPAPLDGAAAADAPTAAAAVDPLVGSPVGPAAGQAVGPLPGAPTGEAGADDGPGSSRGALAACLLAGFATLVDAAVITYTTPAVSADLGGGAAGVQWLLASFSLTFGLGLAPAGRLGDAYGRRTLFSIGMGLFVLGGLASALAPGIGVLIAARLLQGLGAGIISAQVLGTIQDLFHGAGRMRALALYTGAGALAALLGPLGAGLLLGLLPPELAWRAVLAVPVPFGIAALLLGSRGMPPAPGSRATAIPPGAEAPPQVDAPPGRTNSTRAGVGRARRPSLDLPAVTLLAGIVVMLMLPVVQTGGSRTLGIGAVTAVAIATSALLLWERGYARQGRLPLFAPELVRSPGFLVGNAVALLWFGANLSVSAVVTIHLLQVSGLSALIVAALFGPAALARIITSLASGRIFAAHGPRSMLAALAVQTGLLAALALLSARADVLVLLVAAGIAQAGIGLCAGVIEPQLRAITLSFATRRTHGVAASFLQLTQRLSATYLIALTTGILLSASGASSAAGLAAALGVCALVSAVALVAGLHPAIRRWGEAPAREAAGGNGRDRAARPLAQDPPPPLKEMT
jgi:MFS family permease